MGFLGDLGDAHTSPATARRRTNFQLKCRLDQDFPLLPFQLFQNSCEAQAYTPRSDDFAHDALFLLKIVLDLTNTATPPPADHCTFPEQRPSTLESTRISSIMFDLFGTGVKLHAPPLSSIKLFPDDPLTLPPPSEQGTLKCPFPIDPEFYNAALATTVPITFAAGYFTFVVLMNQINRRRTYRAWGLSKTKAFFGFTVIHNILLALYSAVTFAAMVRMVYVSFPGWFGEHGVVGAVDGLCKMHGPRGYGEAVTYNSTTQSWSSKNHFVNLGPGGILPDDTDVGRFWNEGLAFWGWFFYLSKFYEVLDTVIILAKGKRSSTLQTYHHTGAMFCMWAGIRYMSTPIYLFVLINSFIHSLMVSSSPSLVTATH